MYVSEDAGRVEARFPYVVCLNIGYKATYRLAKVVLLWGLNAEVSPQLATVHGSVHQLHVLF